MPENVVPKCMQIVNGAEVGFLSSYLGCSIPAGREEECALIAEAMADAFPQQFIKAVGAYLYGAVEVA